MHCKKFHTSAFIIITVIPLLRCILGFLLCNIHFTLTDVYQASIHMKMVLASSLSTESGMNWEMGIV